jgi:hypothetical protein
MLPQSAGEEQAEEAGHRRLQEGADGERRQGREEGANGFFISSSYSSFFFFFVLA